MHVTQINMAKTGYLFLAKGYKAREEDIAWMKEFGCDSIVIEEGIKERLRPQWRKLLTPLKKGDEIVTGATPSSMVTSKVISTRWRSVKLT